MSKHRWYIVYGAGLALMLFILKWLELRFVIYDHAFEIYAGALAIIFTALGIWLAVKLMKPKTLIIEKEVYRTGEFVLNEKALIDLDISKRELEVLQLMAEGMSNAEIGKTLFLSEHTVKTHCANLFFKLDVKRRTQAIQAGKIKGLIP